MRRADRLHMLRPYNGGLLILFMHRKKLDEIFNTLAKTRCCQILTSNCNGSRNKSQAVYGVDKMSDKKIYKALLSKPLGFLIVESDEYACLIVIGTNVLSGKNSAVQRYRNQFISNKRFINADACCVIQDHAACRVAVNTEP